MWTVRGEADLKKGNVRPTLKALAALHTFRGFALFNGWLWMLFYNFAPQYQEDKIQ